MSAQALGQRFPVPGPPLHQYNIGTGLPRFDHGWNKFWWVLKIRINHHDSITGRMFQAGSESRFFAKVTGQFYQSNTTATRQKTGDVVGAPVFAAVINENQLGRYREGIKNRQHPFQKNGQHCSFVEDGYDDGKNLFTANTGRENTMSAHGRPTSGKQQSSIAPRMSL